MFGENNGLANSGHSTAMPCDPPLCCLPSSLNSMVSPAIFPSRLVPISCSSTCPNLPLFGSREPRSQWFSLSGICLSQALSHVPEAMPSLPTILGFPSVLVTLNILQAEMPRREWQKDFAIPSHEFVVKRLFIKAWNMWKQNKVLRVTVTCSVKNWSEY